MVYPQRQIDVHPIDQPVHEAKVAIRSRDKTRHVTCAARVDPDARGLGWLPPPPSPSRSHASDCVPFRSISAQSPLRNPPVEHRGIPQTGLAIVEKLYRAKLSLVCENTLAHA